MPLHAYTLKDVLGNNENMRLCLYIYMHQAYQPSNGYSSHFIYQSLFDIKVMFVWNSHDDIKMHFTPSKEKSDLAQRLSLKKTLCAFFCDADKF